VLDASAAKNVTLTFDLGPQKPNQFIFVPQYTNDKNWRKSTNSYWRYRGNIVSEGGQRRAKDSLGALRIRAAGV